ncbi:MAG: hypothetical protein P8X74_03715 [Reinekea sp.]
MKHKMLSDEEIKKAWGHANFRDMEKLDVIKQALLKVATGSYQGFTSHQIVKELGLVRKNYTLTARGKYCLYELIKDQIII